ncbi:ferritin-like domain-containing protein [Paraburkholderia tagetis]|uniref:Ferritin-like domain-containing protein n=1 Tax=Paraburkholderia tagetis TaxID=2913261 RepID=A0A9X1RMR5_9BURK|nr:ferritin-like domain-containing protein [Paraburkholderia tagetis]MCG5074218.1 ferritin-like domain-containing protein [Paraburkholderia tagetis]
MSETLTHSAEGASDDESALADQDAALRHWTYDRPGPIRMGSDEHRKMFCRMLLDTHDPYRPAVLDWPKLEPDALRRLTSLPIWDIAVQTEGRASIRVKTYAATLADPLLRTAIDMDGEEEARHKVVLSHLVEAYGIALAPEPTYPSPKDPEWAWMFTGYSECIDSFFAFGLFRSAQRSGFFPAELVETFEPVIQEEARHILFFANWVAWYRRNLPWWRRPWHSLRVAGIWIKLVWDRVAIARGIDAEGVAHDSNFLPANRDVLGDSLKPCEMIELCLHEDQQRMRGYDSRLLRPTLVPALARIALRFIRK